MAFIIGAENPLGGYIFQALLDQGVVPACVLIDEKKWSDKDLLIHRDRTGSMLPANYVEDKATKVETVLVENHNSSEALTLLTDRGCQLVANGGTPRILSEQFLAAFSAVINCHPGILPHYRGCTCVEWAVFNDYAVGNTTHLMTAGIDEGPIIRSEEVQILSSDDYVSTRVKVFEAGFSLLAQSTHDIASSRIDASSLEPQGPGTYWRPIDDDRLAVVKRKLGEGLYRYQR